MSRPARKVVSWNVNGIRAALGKGLLDWMAEEAADVYCFQETKIDDSLIEKIAAEFPDYHAAFHCAQKKGYSGVAILSREKPLEVRAGCGNPDFDAEGRVLRADWDDFSLINFYYPSGSAGSERQVVKEAFMDHTFDWVGPQREARPELLLVGDYNICHREIDIHHPERHKGVSGFLPNEREWMSRLLEAGFVDTYRRFDEAADRYSWWSYRSGAKQKNLGWRIDYQLAGPGLADRLTGASLRAEVNLSDHCPTVVEWE